MPDRGKGVLCLIQKNKMSVKDVNAAINKCKWLKLSEKRILIGLWSFWNKSLKIYASHQYFSDNWGLSQSTVKRGIKTLEGNGILISNKRAGNTSLIEFPHSEKKLIELLGANDPTQFQNDTRVIQNDIGMDKKDPTDIQNELSSEVNLTYNTEEHTDSYKERNIEINKETYTDYHNENLDSSFNSLDKQAELIPRYEELKFSNEISNEMKHFQGLIEKFKDSNLMEAFRIFQHDSGKRIALFNDENGECYFTVYGNGTTTRTTQTRFERSKFLVLDTTTLREIISQYD